MLLGGLACPATCGWRTETDLGRDDALLIWPRGFLSSWVQRWFSGVPPPKNFSLSHLDKLLSSWGLSFFICKMVINFFFSGWLWILNAENSVKCLDHGKSTVIITVGGWWWLIFYFKFSYFVYHGMFALIFIFFKSMALRHFFLNFDCRVFQWPLKCCRQGECLNSLAQI